LNLIYRFFWRLKFLNSPSRTEMDKINLKIILLAFSAITLIFSLAFAFLFSWPKYLELNSLRNDIRIKQDELDWQKEYFKKLIQTKAELKNYEAEFSKISAALPDDNSVPSFLNFFQTAASQSGLILTSVSPFTVVPSLATEALAEVEKKESSSIIPAIKETQLSVVLDGPYPVFKNFLSVLERSSRFIDVENISFSSPKEKDIFTFSIKIKFYSY